MTPFSIVDLEQVNTNWVGFFKVRALNPIQDGHFWVCSRIGKKVRSLKSVKDVLQWWNLAQLYLNLNKIKKPYKSRDRPFEFCWYQYFLIENQQLFLGQEYTNI